MTDSMMKPPQEQRRTLMEERAASFAGSVQMPSAVASKSDQPPVRWLELVSLLLIVALCDVTIYRGKGFTGLAVLFTVLPVLLSLGIVRRRFDKSWAVMAFLLALTAIRLVWCGSILAVAAGFVVLCGLVMSLSGIRPYVLQGAVFAAHLVSAGHRGLHHYSKTLARYNPRILHANWVAFLLPIVALLVFGTIFVMANPDLVKSFSGWLHDFAESMNQWLAHVQPLEIVFWIGVGWITVGMLRPDVHQVTAADDSIYVSVDQARAPLYDAYRNTLLMVMGLFAVYLIFEFQTLWFRVFPKGFHYSGYAHEGAAWLTVALGLATLTLSIIFREPILDDPRLPYLRRLAWIWSIENLVLAISVFNRLFIYVGFNGMTRMRVVGLLGVASVVAGFLLVLRKIARNYDFVWLIRRQLWTVTFAAYLYAVLPVDLYVNSYNARRILAGDPAPSVQISVHPTSAEGFLCLAPLMKCQDEFIQKGVKALLANKLADLEHSAPDRKELGWTAWQYADDRLLEQLRGVQSEWLSETDGNWRASSLDEFHRYAYQWY